MSATENGNSPASAIPGFVTPRGDWQWPQEGLTKREAFAMNAPPEAFTTVPETLGAAAKALGIEDADYLVPRDYPKLLAQAAVQYADALLAQLERKPS